MLLSKCLCIAVRFLNLSFEYLTVVPLFTHVPHSSSRAYFDLLGPKSGFFRYNSVHLGAQDFQPIPKQVVLDCQAAHSVLLFNFLLSARLIKDGHGLDSFQFFGALVV